MPRGVYQRQVVPVLDRLARRTEYDPETGCLVWMGGKNKAGYGVINAGRRDDGTKHITGTHRAAWEALVGPIPEGLELDHFLCENSSCWNITHLRPATPRENVLRGDTVVSANAAKELCPRNHPYDKVNNRGQRCCRRCEAETNRRSKQVA